MEFNSEDLASSLKTLKLYYTADNLASLAESLQNRSPLEIIRHLATLETVERHNRNMNRRMRDARIGRFRHFEEFDWNWPTSLDRSLLKGIFERDAVATGKNLIILGPQGIGKTMIAKNLAWQAVQKGHKVRLVTASSLVTDLLASGHRLESRLRYYARIDLLVIDELGYLSFQDRAADLLFEVVSRRYERAPIILTSNLAFKDWPNIFPGAACVAALLDRLIHNCDILTVQGDSYRKREAKSQKKGHA